MTSQIFIVDDDEQMLALLRDIFELDGWQVKVANDISGAKEALETCNPDCFIIDLKLPDGDGSELIRHIKHSNNSPILAISGAISGDDSFSLPASCLVGADYHMSKPFQPDELIIECKRLTSLSR